MAAGHFHHDKFSRHQQAEGVAVPKLQDAVEGSCELPAENWMRAISESRYHVDCLGRHVDINERLMETERLRINESSFRVDCPMQMGDRCLQEYHSLSAQIG